MTDRLFLTREEIKQLTGTADRKRQVECLKSNNIPATLDVFGRPVVTIAAIEGSRRKEDVEPVKDQGFMPSWLKVA